MYGSIHCSTQVVKRSMGAPPPSGGCGSRAAGGVGMLQQRLQAATLSEAAVNGAGASPPRFRVGSPLTAGGMTGSYLSQSPLTAPHE